MTTAYIATFSDGYKRTVAGPMFKTKLKALAYAKSLERWFLDGGYDRHLISVEPKA